MDGVRNIKEVREQDTYLGDIPIMTPEGTFVVNGVERVVVSQIQRSPGVCFDKDIGHNGVKNYVARAIPFQGAWIDFEFSPKDVMYVRIDRKRKFFGHNTYDGVGVRPGRRLRTRPLAKTRNVPR